MKALSRIQSEQTDVDYVVDVTSNILIKLRECVLEQKKEKENLYNTIRSESQTKERYR